MVRLPRTPLALIVVVLVAAGLGAACEQPAAPGESLAVATLDQADDSAVRTQTTFVVRDAETLRRVWATLFDGRPRRDLPAIDFSRHMLVIVAIGVRPTTGYQVRITSATRSRRGIVVHVSVLRPADDCVVAPAQTSPIAMARLPQSDAPVEFAFTRGIVGCR